MFAYGRVVVPEVLDQLDPRDPLAERSRRDLRRVHRAMHSLSTLQDAITRLRLASPPARILDLGGGDASLMLRLALTRPQWGPVALTVLDRHDLISQEIRCGYERLGWRVTVLRTDAAQWAREQHPRDFDLCVTTLFLHHFQEQDLRYLMAAIAARCDALVACEPQRNGFARFGSRLIGLLGANAVTRGDAVKSVAAGFAGRELTKIWPSSAEWRCDEYSAPPFIHCFTAARRTDQGA